MPDYIIRSTISNPSSETVARHIVGQRDLEQVSVGPSGSITSERLVRAKNEARALAHIVKDTLTCTKATTDDVIRLTAAGVKLETAE